MKRPFVTIKFAQTLDGKIASSDGSSKWISSKESRKFAHRLRVNNDAIIVGIGTIIRDNPSLTTRHVRGKSPIRIIIDPKLRISKNSKVLKGSSKDKTIIFTTKKSSKKKINDLKSNKVEIIVLPRKKDGNIDLSHIIRILYKKRIKKILVEGGSKTITLFIKNKLVDKLVFVISPKILGSGKSFVEDLGIKNIKKALELKVGKIERIKRDIIYVTSFKK